MTWLLWIAGAILLALAGYAVWTAFRSPAFYVGLVRVIFNALLPAIFKRMPPHEETAWNEFKRSDPDKREIAAWKRAYEKRKKLNKY